MLSSIITAFATEVKKLEEKHLCMFAPFAPMEKLGDKENKIMDKAKRGPCLNRMSYLTWLKLERGIPSGFTLTSPPVLSQYQEPIIPKI